MRLLVLRPEPDAGETAAQLRRLGHEVLIEPMLTVALHPEPRDLPEPAAILLTSRNAVRAIERWPRAAGWRDRPVFAVGPETAGLARAAGFTDVHVGRRDGAALAELVAGTLPLRTGAILYAAAHDRTGDLEAILSERGFPVRVVVAYRAAAAERLGEATLAALRSDAVDGVLVHSRRTAETFRGLVRAAGFDRLPRVTFYALSAAVAAPLRALAPAKIRVATHPDGEAMLALFRAG